jgi:hypothetical protein|tara:strand:+ start:308 stop:535 length:228 start_codon:yes stop_codon:yes gene_type:complete
MGISNMTDLIALLVDLVKAAETLWSGYSGAGEAKKAWVVTTINTAVDIPYLPEAIEEQIISICVDMVVELVINRD